MELETFKINDEEYIQDVNLLISVIDDLTTLYNHEITGMKEREYFDKMEVMIKTLTEKARNYNKENVV